MRRARRASSRTRDEEEAWPAYGPRGWESAAGEALLKTPERAMASRIPLASLRFPEGVRCTIEAML